MKFKSAANIIIGDISWQFLHLALLRMTSINDKKNPKQTIACSITDNVTIFFSRILNLSIQLNNVHYPYEIGFILARLNLEMRWLKYFEILLEVRLENLLV